VPELHADATLDCPCGLPMFPTAYEAAGVRYECANRHVRSVALPADRGLRRLIQNWVDRRSGQLDEQHRRWSGEEADRAE
jgi:hypothetical protein